MWAGLHVFKPTQEWALELCRRLRHEGAEGALVISAVEAPPDVSPTGRVALLLEFSGGRCVRAVLSPGSQGGDFVLEGAYQDYLRIFEGKLPPFAAFALGKIRLIKGSLSKLADYMPLALEIVREARKAAGYA
jgi:Putative sterol carrier protein